MWLARPRGQDRYGASKRFGSVLAGAGFLNGGRGKRFNTEKACRRAEQRGSSVRIRFWSAPSRPKNASFLHSSPQPAHDRNFGEVHETKAPGLEFQGVTPKNSHIESVALPDPPS